MPAVAEYCVVTPLAAVRQQRLELELRHLEFSALLQRKNDIERLLEAFFVEAQAFVSFDGLHFEDCDRQVDVQIGERRQQNETFVLNLGERILGQLRVSRSDALTARETRILDRLTETLLYPVKAALAAHAAELRAFTDDATGCRNARALKQQLPRQVQRNLRAERALAVLYMQVGSLDTLCRRCDPQQTDQALRDIAGALDGRLRQSDLIYRVTDDVFLLVLEDTGLGGAEALAERLRGELRRSVRTDNIQYVLSLNVGITELDRADCAESLLERAQRALCEASHTGCNRTRLLPAASPAGCGGDDDPSVA